MIGRIVGALVGREIDRRDGSGGLKGAAIGALAMGAMRLPSATCSLTPADCARIFP